MYTTNAETAPEGSYHYALNMVPVNPQAGSGVLRPRGAFAQAGGTSATNIVAAGVIYTAAGQGHTWILSSTVGIWQLNWATGVWSNVVTAANLTTGGITISGTSVYWVSFNKKIVFSDGANLPWVWDGSSGAGGLTRLTNAAVAYGKPTVYGSKLFFIKDAERDTIIWSEEQAENTGYEAGGYNNSWTLGQTGNTPLTAIIGLNDGLYYFRSTSIGVIRGAVNADFVTASTHDSVSGSVGTLTPSSVAEGSGEVWFVDQQGSPTMIPAGGAPERLWPPDYYQAPGDTTPSVDEPFGLGSIGWKPSANTGPIETLMLPPQVLIPYDTVWFHVPSTATAGRGFLVFSRADRHPICWVLPMTGAAMASVASITRNSNSVRDSLMILFASDGKGVYLSDKPGLDYGVGFSYRVIGAPLGANRTADYQFDRLAVSVGANTGMNLTTQVLTSRNDAAAKMTVGQVLAIASDTYATPTRLAIGLNQSGRWIRPVFTIASTNPAPGIGSAPHDFRIGGWTVYASPFQSGPNVP